MLVIGLKLDFGSGLDQLSVATEDELVTIKFKLKSMLLDSFDTSQTTSFHTWHEKKWMSVHKVDECNNKLLLDTTDLCLHTLCH